MPMPTRIVAISHASGAGGAAVGRKVAERLGFRYIDEEIISLAAAKEGLDTEVVADAERRKNLLERIISDFSRAHLASAEVHGVYWDLETAGIATRVELRQIIIDAIHE